ncbi:MAG: PhzF family phenazine biosynthesis protein [Acidimicrobiales bacterium]
MGRRHRRAWAGGTGGRGPAAANIGPINKVRTTGTRRPGRRAPLVWADAFTDRPFGGNPAAVCLLDGPADDRWMQDLATELGISETAFAWPGATEERPGATEERPGATEERPGAGPDRSYVLRWFSPVTEIDLCGHATLATAHVLASRGVLGPGETVGFSTRSGRLTAKVGADAGEIELDLPADRPAPLAGPPDGPATLPTTPATAVVAWWRGRDDLVAVLSDQAAVAAAVPDLAAVAGLAYRALYVTAPADAPGTDYVLRVFAPGVGIDEDPVTGSAQCLLGPYWAGRLGRRTLTASQRSARGGVLRVEVGRERVRVAGRVVTVVTGEVEPVAAGDVPWAASALATLVAGHHPADARESASVTRFLAELSRLDHPCDESADPVHVTASGIVVGRRGTVLHRHRRLGRWMQPGGHVDPGESPADAARRESEEETGLSLAHGPGGPRLVHIDVHEAANGHTHLDLRYLLVGSDDDPAPPPGESPDARWCSWVEAETMADDALAGGLRSARRVWETMSPDTTGGGPREDGGDGG